MNETVVFLHGAGTGAWIWERVTPHIIASTIALDIPSRTREATPASCASSIVKELNGRGIDHIVLVMHSLAGVLAADIAAQLGDRIIICVYVSAIIPSHGSTFAKTIGFPGRLILPLLFHFRPDGLVPSETMLRKELCGDLNEDDCSMVIDRYEAEFRGLYLSKVGGPPKCRSVYIKLMKDASITQEQQSRMISHLDNPTVFEISSGHLVMLSHPAELAKIINTVLKSA